MEVKNFNKVNERKNISLRQFPIYRPFKLKVNEFNSEINSNYLDFQK